MNANFHLSQYSVTQLIGLFVLITMLPAFTAAQTAFKPGDKVEASPMALKDDKYYKQCTVVSVEKNAYALNCDGAEYTVPSAYVRPSKAPTDPQVEAQPEKEHPKTVRTDGQFKVGDRVLATVNGLKGEKNYRPCTVKSGLRDNAYGLECDPHNGLSFMDFAVRPEWIMVWENATPPPDIQCPFTKDYPKASNKAPASAGLFKSVIFEWQRSVQDFYDFGVTFLNFELGKAFTNRVTGPGRKTVDTAPVGAMIHNVKAKELICQKSSTITKRWVREIEYACYKNEASSWVCKNGAPKYIEQTSIPNK